MSDDDRPVGSRLGADRFDSAVHPELFREIPAKRLLAFAVDVAIVLVVAVPVFVAVLILGVLTFGLGLLLLPFVFAVVALGYLALTLGSGESATIGMRLAGIEMRTLGGEKMNPLLAVLEGLVYWILIGLLTPLVLVVGLMSNRHRLLHDMLLGTIMLNSTELAELECSRGT